MTRRVVAYALLCTLFFSALALRAPGLAAELQSGEGALVVAQATAVPAMPGLGSTVERVYLPLVPGRPPVATLQFATRVNETTGEPLTSSERFPRGTDLLFIPWRLEGFQNRQYRVEVTFPNNDVLATSPRLVPTSDDRNYTSFCRTSNDSCTSERAPLFPGLYTARLFIDNQIVIEQQLLIE